MMPRALRKQGQRYDHQTRQLRDDQWSADRKPAEVAGFVKEVTDNSSKWPREDKCGKNNSTPSTARRKCNMSKTIRAAPKIIADPPYPKPAVSANQSPRAAPRVWEKVIVIQ